MINRLFKLLFKRSEVERPDEIDSEELITEKLISDEIPIVQALTEESDDATDSEESSYDDYNPYEIYENMFNEIVQGTRYEKYARDHMTSSRALDQVLTDHTHGKISVQAIGFWVHQLYEEEDRYFFEIDAYHITSKELEVLKKIVKCAEDEDKAMKELDRIQFSFSVYQKGDPILLDQCYHPTISGPTTIDGNMYDDNIDTYGTMLNIPAIRCYLFYNVDTNEVVVADGTYYVY